MRIAWYCDIATARGWAVPANKDVLEDGDFAVVACNVEAAIYDEPFVLKGKSNAS